MTIDEFREALNFIQRETSCTILLGRGNWFNIYGKGKSSIKECTDKLAKLLDSHSEKNYICIPIDLRGYSVKPLMKRGPNKYNDLVDEYKELDVRFDLNRKSLEVRGIEK
jgi:hypothetical protein